VGRPRQDLRLCEALTAISIANPVFGHAQVDVGPDPRKHLCEGAASDGNNSISACVVATTAVYFLILPILLLVPGDLTATRDGQKLI
jgi:hypothetical protein